MTSKKHDKNNRHKFKYPRLLILVLAFVLAYVIFANRDFKPLHDFLLSLGYLGIFLSGVLYAYGFSAPSATAVLLILSKYYSLSYAVVIAAFGALLSDLVIFYAVTKVVNGEIDDLTRTKVLKFFKKEEHIIFGHLDKYALGAFAGFLIASPLPTEVGVSILASMKHLSVKKFAVIAYLLHALGILLILSIGKVI